MDTSEAQTSVGVAELQDRQQVAVGDGTGESRAAVRVADSGVCVRRRVGMLHSLRVVAVARVGAGGGDERRCKAIGDAFAGDIDIGMGCAVAVADLIYIGNAAAV